MSNEMPGTLPGFEEETTPAASGYEKTLFGEDETNPHPRYFSVAALANYLASKGGV